MLDGELKDETFFVYDLVPMDQFDQGQSDIPQIERMDILNQMFGLFQHKDVNIKIVEKLEINVTDDIEKFKEYKQHLKDLGYTKFVAKNPIAPYVRTKNKNWQICRL